MKIMNKFENILKIRNSLSSGKASIGSWMQFNDSNVAEIMGQSGFDWVAVDMEHGTADIINLPDIFRAIELGGTLPLVRLPSSDLNVCRRVMDAGSGGVIIPTVEDAEQLKSIINSCTWPPTGIRGVGFSRANMYGKNFDEYKKFASEPLIIAMIENVKGLENLEEITQTKGLDAILIGPYDLSASLNVLGDLENSNLKSNIKNILKICKANKIACGIHVIEPDKKKLEIMIADGFLFIPYSMDSMFIRKNIELN